MGGSGARIAESMAPDRVRIGVIDLGTNTTRLLIADVSGGRIQERMRRSEITRLGEGVDATNRLADRAMDRVGAVVGEYRALIDREGVERIVAIATSAMRDAENGDEFRASLRARFGIKAETISGGEEARLTFLGATSARPHRRAATLVIDIGGGSTEFVIGQPGQALEFEVSSRAGSVRQTERHLRDDPPVAAAIAALAEEVRAIIDAEIPRALRASVEQAIAVAGTATSLAAISQELDPYDPERVHGFLLELAEAERILGMLAALPLEERRAVTGLHPDRAPTIVAGAAILVEAIRGFGLDAIEVSEADLLHGAALDTALRGPPENCS